MRKPRRNPSRFKRRLPFYHELIEDDRRGGGGGGSGGGGRSPHSRRPYSSTRSRPGLHAASTALSRATGHNRKVQKAQDDSLGTLAGIRHRPPATRYLARYRLRYAARYSTGQASRSTHPLLVDLPRDCCAVDRRRATRSRDVFIGRASPRNPSSKREAPIFVT